MCEVYLKHNINSETKMPASFLILVIDNIIFIIHMFIGKGKENNKRSNQRKFFCCLNLKWQGNNTSTELSYPTTSA